MRAAVLLALPVLALGLSEWRADFPVDKKALSATGGNPYFVLTPGFRLYYEHGKDTVTTTVSTRRS